MAICPLPEAACVRTDGSPAAAPATKPVRSVRNLALPLGSPASGGAVPFRFPDADLVSLA